MGNWFASNWFGFFQTVGIAGSLLLTARVICKDDQARRVSNAIAMGEQYWQTWKELFDHPELERVLETDTNLEKEPISNKERIFVTRLILHLSTAYYAMKQGEFVELEGLQRDAREIFSLPIPKAVWTTTKLLQNHDFAAVVDSTFLL
jgi:hypothetical protein